MALTQQPLNLPEMTDNYFIYGASGHGRVVLDICQQAGINVQGFIDDNASLKKCAGLPVKQQIDSSDVIVLGIGRNTVRETLFNKFKNQILAIVVHPTSILAKTAEVGKGTVAMARAVVNPYAIVGNGCIINTAAVIEHDCVIGDFSHISPGSILCGNVRVGSNTQVGAGATVLPNLVIGNDCIIGAGAVVTRDVPEGTIVAGNPAKPL